MKKIAVAVLLCMITAFMCSCAGTNDVENEKTSEEEYVVITIPDSLFEDDVNDLDSYVRENDFESAVVNENKSVTVTMTREKHGEILNAKRKNAARKLESMIGGKDTAFVTDVEYDESFEYISVRVNRSEYESAFINVTASTAGITGMIYQLYTEHLNHVEVRILDDKTDEVIETVVYPDELDN